ncbi:MAG: hypothetical protein PHC69_07925 [Ruminiclostridium sp.]|nr:hypothetical protein [Ruminiclostridium sp.]
MPKFVASIGGFTHEGLSANAKALGYELIHFKLDGVKPKTWEKRTNEIKALIESKELAATIIYLHSTLLLQASKSEYRPAFDELLKIVTISKTIVFIFQDNLDGIFTIRHWDTRLPLSLGELEDISNGEFYSDLKEMRIQNAIYRLKDYENRKHEVEALISHIYDSGVEVAPFYVRSDVTIRLQEFLGDVEQGVFLRLFVPNDRLQADQLNSLLSVLERYLKQVEGQSFSIDSRKSDKGIVYIFRTEEISITMQSFNDALQRFDTFMTMCGDHPEQALEILKRQGLSDYDSAYYVDRYSRDYKRLVLDTKHEFERKSLLLKQRLESDIVDQGSSPIISIPMPSVSGIVSTVATGSNLTINIGSMAVMNNKNINCEVEKIINGSIIYNENDKLLLALFSQYADGLESLQCRSDLDQLKDQTVAEPSRQNAKQRLIGFLRKAAKKAGDVAEKIAVSALSKYLESLLNGNG